MKHTSLFLLASLATPCAFGQAFNIDLGSAVAAQGGGAPASTYGAASSQTGQWNEIDTTPANNMPTYQTGNLMDLNGVATTVFLDMATLNATENLTSFSFDEPTTMGDDALLMDNIFYNTGAGDWTITFRNLLPGSYQVYTYAMAPDSTAFISSVDVPAGTGGAQQVGGAFPATGHMLGITYAMHTATVDASGDLEILIGVATGDDSVNGIQLVPGSGVGIGTNYCGPAIPNSTTASGTISANGSTIAADNMVTLSAFNLPMNQFGIFITSMAQGFVPNPGGSQGNICVTGSIGRYNGPGQVLNSGTIGSFSLTLDLNATPQPTGPVSVMAGQTWNYQAWYRDLLGGSPVSNFTDATSVMFQ